MTRNTIFYGVFFFVFILLIVLLFNRAYAVDAALKGVALTTGDDYEYQTLAINLAHGLGYREDDILPPESYHLDMTTPFGTKLARLYQEQGPVTYDANTNFYRAPGYPMFLSLVYRIFGETTLNARYLTVLLVFGAAALLTLTGGIWAGWRGILAGGMVGVLYMLPSIMRSADLDRLLTEAPTTFWITLFSFFFVLYQKSPRARYLMLAAGAFVCATYTRATLLTAFPLLVLFCILSRYPRRQIAAFSILVVVPLMAWSLYASVNASKFIAFTTQGEIAFPQFNNPDVLVGVGSEHQFQGGWNPGWVVNADGTLTSDYRYAPKLGENGWVMGLTFWRDHLLQLPLLFFLKLRLSFWTDTHLAGLYTFGVAIFLVALGLRSPPSGDRKAFRRRVLRVQIILAFTAMLAIYFLGTSIFPVILSIYGLILLLALIYPYGDVFPTSLASPLWFLAFILSHLFTTLLFGDPRFHEPLDPLLSMFGLFGLLVIVEYAISPTSRRRTILAQQI